MEGVEVKPLIFVSIPKCASITIHKHIGTWNHGHPTHNHLRAWEIKEEIGIWEWRKAYSFAVVRNPWDRVLSWYSMHHVTSNPNKYPEIYGCSFEEWVLKGMPHHWHQIQDPDPWQQWEYAYSYTKDRQIVTRVIKLERLKVALNGIFKASGHTELLSPHGFATDNTSTHYPYRAVYTEEMKNIVAEICKKDIELFKYSF